MKSRFPVLAGLALLAGCASPPAPAPAPAAADTAADAPAVDPAPPIETQEIVGVTDRMARAILAVREVASASAPPHILLDPVVNNTTYPIDGAAFLTRVRAELNSKSGGKARFLDGEMLHNLQRERQAQTGAAGGPDADYVLTGKLEGATVNAATDVSDSVLYTFRLTDARTNAVVWEDSVELKRQGLQDLAPVQP